MKIKNAKTYVKSFEINLENALVTSTVPFSIHPQQNRISTAVALTLSFHCMHPLPTRSAESTVS